MEVVVKELPSNKVSEDPEKLRREIAALRYFSILLYAQTNSHVRHPNIANFYGWSKGKGTYLLIREFVPGNNLTSFLASESGKAMGLMVFLFYSYI